MGNNHIGKALFPGGGFPMQTIQRLQNTSFCPDFFNSAPKTHLNCSRKHHSGPLLTKHRFPPPTRSHCQPPNAKRMMGFLCARVVFWGGHRANHRSDTPHSGMINSTLHLGRLKAGFSPTILDDPNGQAWYRSPNGER